MSHFHASDSDSVVQDLGEKSGGNKWDTQCVDFLNGIRAPRKKVEQEYEKYVAYMHGVFQPTMNKQRVLGSIDKEGNPQDPIYTIGGVIDPGQKLPSKKNHADYIDGAGHYNIVQYLSDHKVQFPAIYHVGVGLLCPHFQQKLIVSRYSVKQATLQMHNKQVQHYRF